MQENELVVLLNDDGVPIGSRPKVDVHTADTQLHLAFSCYLLDERGRVLITRRALEKATWPGVWTNSFCGHPGPEESLSEAVLRRARQELNARITCVTAWLPDFRYRAIDASGVVENELCPVFTAVINGDVRPAPAEVSEWTWAEPKDLLLSLTSTPFVFSPWMREQLPALSLAGAFRGGQKGE